MQRLTVAISFAFLAGTLAGCTTPAPEETPFVHDDGSTESSFAIRWEPTAPWIGDEVEFWVEGDGGHAIWDFGDGTGATGLEVSHAFRAAGAYELYVQVSGPGWHDDASVKLSVRGPTEETNGSSPSPSAEGGTDGPPRVIVGVSDTGINPYHAVYYRPTFTAHPCTWVVGYTDCEIEALPLTVGPDGGSYEERLAADAEVWDSVRSSTWYWIPQTNIVAVHCDKPYLGTGTEIPPYTDGICILDDTKTHGTQTTSSVLSEAPETLLVFNEGTDPTRLAYGPVPIDIESNQWGYPPNPLGFVNGPTGMQLCDDSVDAPFSLKFRSAGNNGPVPNMGDCARNGYRSYSVGGGYPGGYKDLMSGGTPDFASYMCRPAAEPQHTTAMDESICGTSFAAPTAAGTAAAALLQIRRELDYHGGSTATHVAPNLTHEAFMDAVIWAATYDPAGRPGFPSGGPGVGEPTEPTPWLYWGWGWLDAQVIDQIVDCAMGRDCPDNKSTEAWTFNDLRRSFASDGDADR